MKERLTIRNFGPIKDMTIELRVINIFIGDQGTGKSTVAKVLMIAKELLEMGDANSEEQESDWNMIHFQDELMNHELSNYLRDTSYIELNSSKGRFKYENKQISLKAETGKHVKNTYNTYIGAFIPSYREASALLKNSINALAALKVPLPKWFFLFGQKLTNAKLAQPVYDYGRELEIKYKYANEIDIIVLKDGKEIKWEEASSAIHSSVPMLLVFDNTVNSMHPTVRKIVHWHNRPYIIIEEPELNCFPTTQKKIMEHLIKGIKYEKKEVTEYWCGLIISTHSPYILTSLNNMLYAHTVGQKDYAGTIAILNEEFWLNPNDVSAFMLSTDGRCEDIFNREEGLIDAGKIDGVTDTLNEEFNALLNLELLPK